ncbi:uncharacterized protein JCM6883_002912 [Sporobolomyces salmoneus]|uniref:uncharacterized protein n=1 Tax=Sporobolomyces salmoneus TaxID=183962 RepID=UPI00316FAC76
MADSLPLTSLLTSHLPSHPLPSLVFDPVLAGLERIERILFLSRPSTVLQRLGASRETVVGILGVAFVGLLARWRRQWRAFMLLLGVGEAVGRTLKLIERAETKEDGAEEEEEKGTSFSREVQHLLSFWTLYFSLSLLESFRTSPPISPLGGVRPRIATRIANSLKSLRYTYIRFLRLWIIPLFYRSRYAYLSIIQNNPRLDFSQRFPTFPSVPFASRFANLLVPTNYFPRPSSSFPQPLPASSDRSRFENLPLPHSYFASSSSSTTTTAKTRFTAEVRWELVKLLILWTGLRRDSFGAKSVLFDWILGPVVRKWNDHSSGNEQGMARRSEDQSGGASDRRSPGGGKPRRTRRDENQNSTPAQDSVQEPPTTSSFSGSHSPSRLPHSPSVWTTRTPPRSSRKPASFLPASPADFPPHYRLASSRHPLLHDTPSTTTTTESESSTTSSRRWQGGGRDSLLLESPPRLFPDLYDDEIRRRSYSSDLTSEEEDPEEKAESLPRTEAEEGIKRWGTVLRFHSDSAVDILTAQGEEGELRGLEASGRGWSL